MKTAFRIASLLLTLILVFSALPVILHAEGNGEGVLSGSGTIDDPFLVSTPADFAALTALMNDSTSSTSACGAGMFYRQTADIDMTGYAGYDGTHVENDSRKVYFGGVYDGAGHTLTVNITSEGQTAVFPYITGVILNLKIAGSITSPKSSTASGTAQPIRTMQAGSVIANCVFDMTLTAPTANGVAYSSYGTMFNVYVTGVATKAVYKTNSGGSYYHVFTNVQTADGTPLTHSTCTASNDLDAIAAAFNDREDSAFTSGIAALTAACPELTEEALGEVTVENGALVLSDGVLGGGSVQTLSGSGTQADPYLIGTPDDFKLLTDYMNACTSSSAPYGAGCFFLQTADIDMTGYEGYDGTHVLNDSRKVYFGGIYNGAGHTLTVDITSEGQTAVFPYITGAILNLKIAGSIDSGTATSTASAQPIRAMQAGSVVANCIFEGTMSASKGHGIVFSLYGTLFNAYVTGVATTKAVYSTNTGSCLHVFTNVTKPDGSALTHSTCTASNDLDAIAAAFNDRADEAFTSGVAALAAVDPSLTADVLLPVHKEAGALVFGEAPEPGVVLGVYDGVFTSSADGVNRATVVGSLAFTTLEAEALDSLQVTLEFKKDGTVVNTKNVTVNKVCRTVRGVASVSSTTAAAQHVAYVEADYIFGITVQNVPAGSYEVSVTVGAIVSGETATSVSTGSPLAFEF